MKTTMFRSAFLGLLICLSACQSDPSPKTGEELDKMKAQLEAKKKELNDKAQIAEIEKELKALNQQIKAVEKGASAGATSPAPTAPAAANDGSRGKITGTAVTMRKEASVQSDKLGSFDANESVEVLETKNVNNENEAILTKPIQLYTDSDASGTAAMTLPKGKAVIIENYDSDQNRYQVSYQDAKQGKLYANIDANAVETISYSTWYKVRRSNGQTGWVLGKFLQI